MVADEGITAIAIYEYVLASSYIVYALFFLRLQSSYEAAEDNEISFAEGDRIVEIEAASDEWWQGKDQHGNVGLFPGELNTRCRVGSEKLIYAFEANYVEVQE